MSDIPELKVIQDKVDAQGNRLTALETRYQEISKQLDKLTGVPIALEVLHVQVSSIKAMIEEDRREKRDELSETLKGLRADKKDSSSSGSNGKSGPLSVMLEVIRLLMTTLLAVLGIKLTGV